jgi:hypothetical protein
MRIQYSVRSLLFIMLFSGLGFAWIAHERLKIHKLQLVLEGIERCGGSISYRPPPFNGLWRVVHAGQKFDGFPDGVSFAGSAVRNDDLIMLEGLPIRSIVLGSTQVDGNSLGHLTHVVGLGILDLSLTKIDDDSLAYLGEMPNLRRLDISATAVTDKGMKHLRRCTQLRELSIRSTKVSDAAAEDLCALKNLEAICFFDTCVTSAGFAALQKCHPNIEEIP